MTSEVGAVREFGKLATRSAGAQARTVILELLDKSDIVQIDMIGMNLSPSFADEFFGLLAQQIGIDEYRRRIRLTNLSDAAHALIRHVVYRRTADKQTTPTGLQIPNTK